MTRTAKLLLLPVFLLQFGYFWYIARHRFIDGDEGFYLLASRLVMEHKRPYLDFFYTQAPLLPYVYGLWMRFAGISWIAARTFAALLTATVGVLLYWQVCWDTRRWAAGLAAVLLYACNTLVFVWFPVAKTFSLATLFLFGAYLIASRFSTRSPGWLIALAGLLLGLSIDTRSYVVGLVPVFLGWTVWRAGTHKRIAAVLWCAGGLVTGLVPSLYLFAASPDVYLFNNLEYHAMRTNAGLIGDWGGKVAMLAWGLLGGHHFNGLQFGILCFILFIAVFVARTRRGVLLLAWLIAFVLGFISLLPTPVYPQYFSICMPFVIVAAVCGVNDYLGSLHRPLARRAAAVACLVLVASVPFSSVGTFRRYLITGEGVPGLDGVSDAPNWTLEKVSAVSTAIDRWTTPGEPVASFWPGYLFQSWASPYPGFENDFSRPVASQLNPEQCARYHLASLRDIRAIFATQPPRIAVLGNQDYSGTHAAQCESLLRSDGYELVQSIGGSRIYQCCSSR